MTDRKVDNLTVDRLRELLCYNSSTGVFTWAERRGRVNKGDIAGTYDKDGYIQIRIDGVTHKASRLAWMYVHNVTPLKMIDHKNTIKDDNRIDNLREASSPQNGANSVLSVRNKTGVKGAYFFKGKYRLKVYGIHVGSYLTIEECEQAYFNFSTKVSGQFARLS